MKALPNLTFPMLPYGTHRTPQDFCHLLYRGGAGASIETVSAQIGAGKLGPLLCARLPLVEKLHAAICAEISKGQARSTVEAKIRSIRTFVAWCDVEERSLTLASVEADYRAWTESLLHRVRVQKSIGQVTAYGLAGCVDRVLSVALDIERGLLRRTRMKPAKQKKRVLGTEADKQRLQVTFAFGHTLLDIVQALTLEATLGPLPVRITLRNGSTLEEWSKLLPLDKVKGAHGVGTKSDVAQSLARRAAWEADRTLRTRHPLINLRIESELLIFLAQTGMNLSQAHRLKRGQFRFQTSGEDVLVFRVYKERRGGEAEFRIYRSYRPLFERYLQWLEALVPVEDDERMFPFVYLGTVPPENSPPRFEAIRARCKKLAIRFCGARQLRKTRLNWMLRRSQDPTLTAEQSQHTTETLIRVYQEPHHQVAAAEIAKFHRKFDPSIAPPGPGACVGVLRTPRPNGGAIEGAPTPDCVSPAGCLFCDFHRDIDSAEYVWALATFRLLKLLELSKYKPPASDVPVHPATAVINRITKKLDALTASSEVRALWVREALDRVREGRYHPSWDGFIQVMELAA